MFLIKKNSNKKWFSTLLLFYVINISKNIHDVCEYMCASDSIVSSNINKYIL